MSTKKALAYANVLMGNIGSILTLIGRNMIIPWKRFIDNTFLVCTGTEEELKTYVEAINQVQLRPVSSVILRSPFQMSHSAVQGT